MQVYIRQGDNQFGPFPIEQVKQYVAVEQVRLTDLACVEGSTIWQTVEALLRMPSASSSPSAVTPSVTSEPITGTVPLTRPQTETKVNLPSAQTLRVLGVIAGIGVLLPWISVRGAGGELSRAGFHYWQGWLSLCGSAIAIYNDRLRNNYWILWLSGLTLLGPILFGSTLVPALSFNAELVVEPGIGLYVTGLMGIILLFVAYHNRQKTITPQRTTAEVSPSIEAVRTNYPIPASQPVCESDASNTDIKKQRDNIIRGTVLTLIVVGVTGIAVSSHIKSASSSNDDTERQEAEAQADAAARGNTGQLSTCSQEAAEETLLEAAHARSVPYARLDPNTTWQPAGPCSWLITGRLGWVDQLSNEPVTETFSAAVSRQDGGGYNVDMFQITGGPP